MRTRFSTRAALVGLAPVAALALRAAPTGSEVGAARADGLPHARAAAAIDASDVSYPLDREDEFEVSRSDVDLADLRWPAPGPITSPFGDHRNHPGIDIDGNTGDPVLAAGAGTVTMAGLAPGGFSGYGTIVAIDHGGGLMTFYAHLSKVTVVLGQLVQSGQLIGAIGTTGYVTGSHLHFEVRVANHPVDPVPWLPTRA